MPGQALPMLLTKIHIPAARAAWLPRARLYDRLDAMTGVKIGVLAAPAGYGKTALLAQWINTRQSQGSQPAFAWYALDDTDNDPIHFWSYVVSALQAAIPGRVLGQDFLEILHAPGAPELQSRLALLINEIAQAPLEIVLVLDDVHTLTNTGLIRQLSFFLENLPESLHLVLSGRSEPPLPLARYRAGGQVIQLQTADLQFNRDETGAFFRQCTDLKLSGAEVEALNERAEGWIAGLQLASLSLEGVADRLNFIRSFVGSDRYLLDYLAEEILARQPEVVRLFLLQTSILDRLSPELCEAVLTQPVTFHHSHHQQACRAILEYLDHANLFLTPLDSERTWYRYHRLVADLLQNRLRQEQPALLPDLHRRASRWFAENQFFPEAFQHAAAASDFETAADLIRETLPDLIAQGEVATLSAWLASFPEDDLRQTAVLCLAQSWVDLFYFHFEDAETWAVRAETLLQSTPQARDSFPGQIEAIRATVAINVNQFDAGIRLSRRALEQLPPDPRLSMIRGLVNLNLGDAYASRQDYPAGIAACEAALDAARPYSNHSLDAIILGSLGNQYIYQGRYHQAERVLRQAFAVEQDYRQHGGESLLALGKPLIALARIYIEWNQLDLASQISQRALDYCQRWDHPTHLLEACLVRAEVCRLTGDQPGCQAALSLAWNHAQRLSRHPAYQASLPAKINRCQARLALRDGDWQAAERFLMEYGLPPDPDALLKTDIFDFEAAVCQARVWLQSGRLAQAQTLAEHVSAKAHATGRRRSETEALLIQAWIAEQQNSHSAAQALFMQALALAEPENYARTFLDGGEMARQLLEAQLQPAAAPRHPPIPTRYIQRLLSGFAHRPDDTAPRTPHPQDALLSERERQILRLLAAGLTNDQIAAELILSTNTIKTHLKRIFEKLGAANRTEAVGLAREQGWI